MPAGLDPEIGEMAYEFYCAMAQKVSDYRDASMRHYEKFWSSVNQLPKPEQLILFRQEMDRQLKASGIQEFDDQLQY